MKKFLFLVLCIITSLNVSAQWKTYFETIDGKQGSQFFQLNREGKEFNFELGGDEVFNIKNYQKNGNIETFDIYEPSENKLAGKVKIENKDATCNSGHYSLTDANSRYGFKNCSYDFKIDDSSSNEADNQATLDPKSTVADKAKNAANKVKSIFKKKE